MGGSEAVDGIAAMDPAKILAFGIIGLGFLLAVLAVSVIRSSPENPRPVYAFLVFSLAVMALGVYSQFLKDEKDKLISRLTSENKALSDRLGAIVGARAGLLTDVDAISASAGECRASAYAASTNVNDLGNV